MLDRFFNDSMIGPDQMGEDGLNFLGAVVWSTAWIGEAYGALAAERAPAPVTAPET